MKYASVSACGTSLGLIFGSRLHLDLSFLVPSMFLQLGSHNFVQVTKLQIFSSSFLLSAADQICNMNSQAGR